MLKQVIPVAVTTVFVGTILYNLAQEFYKRANDDIDSGSSSGMNSDIEMEHVIFENQLMDVKTDNLYETTSE